MLPFLCLYLLLLLFSVPEILPDGPADNPALVMPKGEQQMIQFNDITPILSLRAFLKNVTQFDAILEELISGISFSYSIP